MPTRTVNVAALWRFLEGALPPSSHLTLFAHYWVLWWWFVMAGLLIGMTNYQHHRPFIMLRVLNHRFDGRSKLPFVSKCSFVNDGRIWVNKWSSFLWLAPHIVILRTDKPSNQSKSQIPNLFKIYMHNGNKSFTSTVKDWINCKSLQNIHLRE